MRRSITVFVCLLLLLCTVLPVSAANCASKVSIYATVEQDESCQVTVTVTLHAEENSGSLRFPVPVEATSVSLNGSRVWTSQDTQAQYVDLSSVLHGMTGDFTFTVQYRLPDVVHTCSAGQPELQLPLLSGFEDPVASLDFSVTLPGAVTAKPAFSSGYHQSNIEKDLSFSTRDNAVTGRSLAELKDRETLNMTLTVEEAMFPNAPIVFTDSTADDTAMLLCALAALLYWLLFLRTRPARAMSNTVPPEGVSAGQLGTVMTLQKSDLSLTVLSWAQLGYVQLCRERGRVILYKQMEMGNERSGMEQRYFHMLFGKRDRVDTSGLRYAGACRELSRQAPHLQELVQRKSGNPNLFYALSALIPLFGGVSFAIAVTQGAALQGFWIVVLAALGFLCGFVIQRGVRELLLRKTGTTAGAVLAAVLWLLLGVITGQPGLAVIILLSQWAAGLMAAFGGRRTEAGRQELSRILGLRRYLKTVPKDELTRIQQQDPEYFYRLLPSAVALGVDRQFARRFGNAHLPVCPYLRLPGTQPATAAQWCEATRQLLREMDRRTRLLPLEALTHLFSPTGKR